MKNIVLARVDDRLIHGEVVSVWTPNLSANRIVIADDEVAADKFNVKLLKLLAPAGVKVNVYTVDEAGEKLNGEFKKEEKIIILVKSPIAFDRMIKAGLELKDINLGGMGLRNERTPFVKNVSCSPLEIESIKSMMEKGVHIYYQLVPEQQVIEVSDVLKKRKE